MNSVTKGGRRKKDLGIPGHKQSIGAVPISE